MFIAYNNCEKYAHMRRKRDLHGLLLTEKYETKDTKLKKGNNPCAASTPNSTMS